ELPFLIMTTLPDDPDLFFHRVGRVGRADRMGLAICLAATSPEQMWFHRCANRGQGCRNTRLVKEGGCTIWYDETACLKAIEDRVGGPLPRMDAGNFSCPGIVDPLGVLGDSAGDNIRKRRPGASSETGEGATRRDASGAPGPVVYGKARNDQNLLSTMKHLQEISGAVSELEILEREMQKQFVTLAARGI
ncbi:putative ATP-dependent RNA helicase DDX1, partial [Toxoplasma gondii FOU]